MQGARRAGEDPQLRRSACAARCATSSRRTPRSYGDARRSPIVRARGGQGAWTSPQLMPYRAGHRGALREGLGARRPRGTSSIRSELSYKAGDAFLHGGARAQQPAGGLPRLDRPHLLAAQPRPALGARPGRAARRATSAPPPGADLRGRPDRRRRGPVLLATDAGYGFLAPLGDLQTRHSAGKAVLTLSAGRAGRCRRCEVRQRRATSCSPPPPTPAAC